MTTSAKTEATKTEKPAPKATAKEAPKAAPKAAQKPATAPKPETAKAPTAPAAPAAEKVTAPAPEAPAAEATEQPMKLSQIFAEMLFGLPTAEPKAEETEVSPEEFANSFLGAFLADLAEGKLPEGVAFAPEGFGFDLFDQEDEVFFCDVPCGVEEVSPEEVFAAGVAEGLSRANHPAYGIGRQRKAPAPAPIAPIQVVDQTTASFGHLVELQKLHAAGILTDAEYEDKKHDILRRIY